MELVVAIVNAWSSIDLGDTIFHQKRAAVFYSSAGFLRKLFS